MNPVTCRDCINFRHENFTSGEYYAAISDLFSIVDNPLNNETDTESYVASVRLFAESVWKVIRSVGIQRDNPDCYACSMRQWVLEFPMPYSGSWPSDNFFTITCNGSIFTVDRSRFNGTQIEPIYVIEISVPGYNNSTGQDICVSTKWDSNGRKSNYQPLIKSRSWADKANFGHLLNDVCTQLLIYIQSSKFDEARVDAIFGSAKDGEVDDEL